MVGLCFHYFHTQYQSPTSPSMSSIWFLFWNSASIHISHTYSRCCGDPLLPLFQLHSVNSTGSLGNSQWYLRSLDWLVPTPWRLDRGAEDVDLVDKLGFRPGFPHPPFTFISADHAKCDHGTEFYLGRCELFDLVSPFLVASVLQPPRPFRSINTEWVKFLTRRAMEWMGNTRSLINSACLCSLSPRFRSVSHPSSRSVYHVLNRLAAGYVFIFWKKFCAKPTIACRW